MPNQKRNKSTKTKKTTEELSKGNIHTYVNAKGQLISVVIPGPPLSPVKSSKVVKHPKGYPHIYTNHKGQLITVMLPGTPPKRQISKKSSVSKKQKSHTYVNEKGQLITVLIPDTTPSGSIKPNKKNKTKKSETIEEKPLQGYISSNKRDPQMLELAMKYKMKANLEEEKAPNNPRNNPTYIRQHNDITPQPHTDKWHRYTDASNTALILWQQGISKNDVEIGAKSQVNLKVPPPIPSRNGNTRTSAKTSSVYPDSVPSEMRNLFF
jgi:hypothetical protein